MSKSKKLITVCTCGNPLIWTYIFRGSEWFCLKCKRNYPMMNVDSVEKTKELKDKKKSDEKFFNKHRKHLHMGGGMIKDCAKCKEQPHEYHMTDIEQKAHDKAAKALGI